MTDKRERFETRWAAESQSPSAAAGAKVDANFLQLYRGEATWLARRETLTEAEHDRE